MIATGKKIHNFWYKKTVFCLNAVIKVKPSNKLEKQSNSQLNFPEANYANEKFVQSLALQIVLKREVTNIIVINEQTERNFIHTVKKS